MTHEYKNFIDLDEMESMECDCPYSHRRGLSVVAKCDMCGKEHGFDEDRLLAYARELEERIVRLQYAGDVLAELVDHYVPKKEEVLKMWRNA